MQDLATAPALAGPPGPEQIAQEKLTLAAELGRASAEEKRWKEYGAAIKARLTHLHEQGLIETKFTASDFIVSLQKGKAGIKLDADGKWRQEILLASLIAEGHAEKTTGVPFWQVRAASKAKGTDA